MSADIRRAAERFRCPHCRKRYPPFAARRAAMTAGCAGSLRSATGRAFAGERGKIDALWAQKAEKMEPKGAADLWERVTKFDRRSAALADRHYSRRKIGSPQFMPPGQTIILLSPAADAVFGWWRPDPKSGIKAMNGLDGWTCTIFRNESAARSSDLILAAEEWIEECGPSGLITYVWDKKVRSVNPGACFKAAGWKRTGRSADGKKTLLQKPWVPRDAR